MAETVSDILGKGFKYEERDIVQQLTETVTGTIGAFVGAANWGPVNIPTMVLNDFPTYFGTPVTKSSECDSSGLAASYMLNFAPYCWFTRVTDGSDSAAQFSIFKQAQIASIIGTTNISGKTSTIYGVGAQQNNLFAINVNGVTKTIQIPATVACPVVNSNIGSSSYPSTPKVSVVGTPTVASTLWNLVAGASYLHFMIDNLEYRYTVQDEYAAGGRDANKPDFLNLVVPVSGAIDAIKYSSAFITSVVAVGANPAGSWDSYAPTANMTTFIQRYIYALVNFVIVPQYMAANTSATLAQAQAYAASVVSADANNGIVLHSTLTGSASFIQVINIPLIFDASGVIISRGTDNSALDVIAAVDKYFKTQSISATAYMNANNQMQIDTLTAGSTKSLQLIATTPASANLYAWLGLSVMDSANIGVDSINNGGTFLAAYSGADGNTIAFDVEPYQGGTLMTMFFRNNKIGSFFNYSLNTGDPNFIGNLINRDTTVSKYVRFITPLLSTGASVTSIPPFANGITYLVGGKSGASSHIQDIMYNGALDAYRNVDLYNADIFCVSGHTSQSVQDQIASVCAYRKDCFGIVDPPESAAGVLSTPQDMIDWHNGNNSQWFGRNAKLDSEYLATYYPWISINDGTVNAQSTYYAPSVRVMGAFGYCDKLIGNKFAAVAGDTKAPLTGVNSLAVYVREDQKQGMYADELGNSINPIVYTTTRGFFIDGQKNTDRNFGAISRLNVMRTSLYIKKTLYDIAPSYFWSPLNKNTMDAMKEQLTNMCVYLSSSTVNAIKGDYKIICDASVNSPEVEAEFGLVAVVQWTPIRSIEKIKIISVINDAKVTVKYA